MMAKRFILLFTGRAGGFLKGDNFNFEDRHTERQVNRRVSLGSDYAGWECFFKIPIDTP